MAHDGKLLAKARDILAEKKRRNEAERSDRITEVYKKIPEIKQIDSKLTSMISGLAADAIGKGLSSSEVLESIKNESKLLLKKREELLFANGYPENYTDEICCCTKCRDTGYILGKPCACLEAEYASESVRELSSMLDLRDQCFEHFNLSLYPDNPERGHSVSPRQAMSTVFELCKKYAFDFGKDSVNLLFRGGTGLGKTFLSSCIAGVVSKKGYSVVYDTSVSVMDAFESQKFDRGSDNSEEVASSVRRYLGCDLLILDDLGTEMTTGFTQSALYNLVNTRLINGKKTIVSTNLSEDELRRRYSPQLASRIECEYLTLNFYGRDIRGIKRELALK